MACHARQEGNGELMADWIGVDLDGTLAEYHGWTPGGQIGKPVPAMLKRVKQWLKEGREVRIFTARYAGVPNRAVEVAKIKRWCREHVGQELEVTNTKDHTMIELWDDRAVQVQTNTGRPVDPQRRNR
jgi:hypothetical protein